MRDLVSINLACAVQLALSQGGASYASLGQGQVDLLKQFNLQVTPDGSISAAVFVETATVTLSTTDTAMRRNTVPTTRTEQGAGKSWDYSCGFIVLVEKANPALAASGAVTLAFTIADGNTDSPVMIEEGLFAFVKPPVIGGMSVSAGFTGVVNKKATILMIGGEA
jgi:hypothetical protein